MSNTLQNSATQAPLREGKQVMPVPPTMATVDPIWAWTRYEPSPAQPWTAALAAHLYRRAAFGATPAELRQAVERGPRATLDDLLRTPAGWADYNAPQEARETLGARSGDSLTFQAWWLRRLVESPAPLLEKLTLFWHDHFAIGAAKTGDLALFQKHVQLLRAGALGNFRALLGALLADPAMYVALDGDQNRLSQPNVSFARPWLERFTAGPGVASEQDSQGVARAFTGCFVYGGRLRFIAREHDEGNWTILGRAGQFGRDELLDVLVEHPATALNLARELFRWFVTETEIPSETLLRPLADCLRRSETVREPLEMILGSNLFFSRHALGQKIKSPVELAAGLAHCLEGMPPGQTLARDLGNLGQRLDEPPTVHGWPAGRDWINTITLAGRLRMSRNLLGGGGDYGRGLDPWRLALNHGCKTAAPAVTFWLDTLVQDQPSETSVRPIIDAARQAAAGPAAVTRAVASIVFLPEFQLN